MSRKRLVLAVAWPWSSGIGVSGQTRPTARTTTSIQPAALKEWLTYIASDALQGREVYTEGLGLAAGFVAEQLGVAREARR